MPSPIRIFTAPWSSSPQRDAGIKPIVSAEVVSDGRVLKLNVENAVGYANLCRKDDEVNLILERYGPPPSAVAWGRWATPRLCFPAAELSFE